MARGTLSSAEPSAQDAGIEAKAQACTTCHGANGVPLDPKTMPVIAGQQSYYIFKQLVNYRNGMREHPIMTPLAKGLQQSDLRPLADYFASKPWPANTAVAASAIRIVFERPSVTAWKPRLLASPACRNGRTATPFLPTKAW